MFRILRAFAWMRWRMLINSFEKTGSRDVLERFSLAVEKLGPIIAAVLILPTTLFLLAGSTAAGYAIAQRNPYSLFFVALRYILLLAPVAAILGPLFLPSADRTNPVRLLLLPIPRSALYVSQAASAVGEPWIVLTLPILVGIPVGLLAGGAFAGAAFAAMAGLALLLVLVGLAALTTTLLHLVARDRRRAEFLGVVFILAISMAGLVPGLLQGSNHRTGDGRRARSEVNLPGWVETTARRAIAMYPTELYVRGTRLSTAGNISAAAGSAFGLVAAAVALHGIGFLAFSRVLDGPTTSGGRRGATAREGWGGTLPGVRPAVSAVALAHLRLALRTTRGRTTLLSPLAVLLMFSMLAYQQSGRMEFGAFHINGGLALATFICAVSLIAMLPISMNQFAIDGPGLTLVLLSPLSAGEYLAGKALANGILSLSIAFLGTLAVFLMFPAGSGPLWLSLPLGVTATYLLAAPAAAVFSAIFPKQADLSSIGGKGNAHGLAGLLGLLSFVIGAAPCIGIVLLTTLLLDRPWLAPVLLLAWCAIAYAIARLLFIAVQRVFTERRENLGMLVSRLLSQS